MLKTLLLTASLALAAGFVPAQCLAQSPIRGGVEMRTDKSLDEITDYVNEINRRLQKGRYDTVTAKEKRWMVQQIADLRTEVQIADTVQGASSDLQVMAGEFELGIVKIEEGGIVCRKERRTGTRMQETRCFTQKRMSEDAEKSRDTIQGLRRPQSLPSVE